MADEEELSFKDIAQFLNDKKIKQTCNLCGNAGWMTGHGDEAKGLIPVGADGESDFRGLNKSIPTHFLICTNCGHVEFLASKIIRNWKAARAAAPKDGDSDG